MEDVSPCWRHSAHPVNASCCICRSKGHTVHRAGKQWTSECPGEWQPRHAYPRSHASFCRSTEAPLCWSRNRLMALRGTLPMGALRTRTRRSKMGSPSLSSHCQVRALLKSKSVYSSPWAEDFNSTFSFHFQRDDVFGGREQQCESTWLKP